ncbi:polysaccharide biosynthesis C-terminal domain-containing protein [Eoetvoesia caeni]|nr:lipid II flippase MurJ [Eoetvoesiella caeni]MCI2810204.1 polysaccharide biosynthesis C-terminal domain-containing protein [Eoetvoesiella caeni]NYT56521.1 polysaccharide biosynthesis C-terminal domain-containing protein [Eoetvoesiella caeni]
MKTFSQRLSSLHADHRRIAMGAARVAFFLLLGKAAGALKEMAVAYRYGVSDAVDAYQFTITMASWLPLTIVGALSVVLIPVLVRTRYDDRAARARFLGELQGWTIAGGTVLAVLTYLLWPLILDWVGLGLSAQARQMSLELNIAFAPAALLTLVTGISAARLRAHERHINTLLDSVPAVVILVWVLLAGVVTDVGPLMWGTLVGYLIQSAWLLWLAARADGMWGRPRLAWSAHQWPDLVKAAGVMLLGQVAMSFVGPIDQYTAANLGGNANATLGYASRLLSLVLGIGAASVGRAALPVLADIQSRGDRARARSMALKWSVLMLAAGAAATLVGWILAPWGVALLFERGAFTAQDTVSVAHVLRWGLLQLPFYFGVLVLVQLLASQNRYRIMAIIAIANFGLKAVMNFVLAPSMGAAGIMLATSLMYALSYICYVAVAVRSAHAGHTSS